VKKVLLLHGWKNQRPEGHWLRLNATDLRNRGQQVWYPQFPDPDEPKAKDWQELLLAEEALINEVEGGEKIAIAHSLGCINWLVAARTMSFQSQFDRVLFVAPPDPQLLQANTPETGATNLYDEDVIPAIKRYAKEFLILSSDDDRWLPRGIEETYEKPLGVKAVILEGGQHFSLEDGFGPWRGIADWVQSANPADLMRR
jgi:predicted alpha/beta hydrolase family esterase